MSDGKTMTIRVSADIGKWLHRMAEKREEALGETADRILKTARGRLQALETYAKKQSAKARAKGKKRAKKGGAK